MDHRDYAIGEALPSWASIREAAIMNRNIGEILCRTRALADMCLGILGFWAEKVEGGANTIVTVHVKPKAYFIAKHGISDSYNPFWNENYLRIPNIGLLKICLCQLATVYRVFCRDSMDQKRFSLTDR
jgi:hypothetical protein